MAHIVLLGDSIFDNAAYTGGAPDVVRQVRQRLPHGLKAICTEGGDYADPIEPSARGGDKIAKAIVEALERGFTGGRTEVFA